MRILTAAAARDLDRLAIERLGLPALVLMENAALGVVDAIGQRFAEVESAAIFCGPGNNGGDGLAVARQLATRGYGVEVFLVRGGRELSGDAAAQLAVCRRLDLTIRELEEEDGLAECLDAAREHDLVVDALFGTGLARPLTGLFAALVDGLNALPLPRLAVDVPSGLSGDSGEPSGPHVRATVTVTFGLPKVAHVFPPAAEAVGELVVTDLGFPPRLADLVHEPAGSLHLLVGEELAALLPARARDSNKGTFGHLLLVAGAVGKAGAASLAARAAVRAGAGLVTAAVPEPIVPIVQLASLESMCLGLPAGPTGALAAGAADPALAALAGKSAVALGPGLGQDPDTVEAIHRLVAGLDRGGDGAAAAHGGGGGVPLVLDADGLNAFSPAHGGYEILAARGGHGSHGARGSGEWSTVLTPHPGELGRLLGVPTAEIQADRVGAARRAAAATGAVVVLKGSLTLVACPDGTVFVNPTGNPGMATGGTGDVLTGILGGLLAQRLGIVDAACVAVYLHGLAGDLALARSGGLSLAAEDLITSLPAAFAQLAAGSAP